MYFQDKNYPYEAALLVTEAIIEESIQAYKAGDETRAKALKGFATKSQNIRAYESMLALATHKPAFCVDASKFDSDIWSLGLVNGLLDLRTGTLRGFRPNDYVTKSGGAAFVEAATCPQWEAFLLKAFNHDTEMVNYLARVIGYTLSGSTEAQCLWLHYGAGSNGKSTFMNVLSALMGDYAATANASTIMSKPTSNISNDVARLKGARLVMINELEDGKRLAEAEIKTMTGGEALTARYLHQEFITFYPQFKLHLTSNYKPSVYDNSHGLWRRINLINWAVIVKEADQDKQLIDKLKGELSGVLNWALSGLQDYLKNGLQTPQSVLVDTAEFRCEMDSIGQFIDAYCYVDREARGKASELYGKYSEWAKETGRQPVNSMRFGNSLKDKGFTSLKTGGVMVYRGLAVRFDYLN
ncbi:MAG: phage/plasmid primase, P4 family [Nitrosomonadales bacterium]|nr:phage/plasmid primase, P4 family [Nitrosomonadales bacterium]